MGPPTLLFFNIVLTLQVLMSSIIGFLVSAKRSFGILTWITLNLNCMDCFGYYGHIKISNTHY